MEAQCDLLVKVGDVGAGRGISYPITAIRDHVQLSDKAKTKKDDPPEDMLRVEGCVARREGR